MLGVIQKFGLAGFGSGVMACATLDAHDYSFTGVVLNARRTAYLFF